MALRVTKEPSLKEEKKAKVEEGHKTQETGDKAGEKKQGKKEGKGEKSNCVQRTPRKKSTRS